MHFNVAHITGWLVIVVAVLMFIGEAYASPSGAFDEWEQSLLVRRGDGVGAGSRDQASGGHAATVTPAASTGDYLEDAARLDSVRPLIWEFEGESRDVDSESRGHEAEREPSPGGIWGDRGHDREEPSRPAWDPYGDDPGDWDR